jgi:hypothetical protein
MGLDRVQRIKSGERTSGKMRSVCGSGYKVVATITVIHYRIAGDRRDDH